MQTPFAFESLTKKNKKMKTKKMLLQSAILVAACIFQTAKAQFSISGNVSGPDKRAIPFSVIGIRNTFISTQANSVGDFKIKGLNSGTYILQTACVGYKTRFDTVKLTDNYSLNIELSEEDIRLDEVSVSSTRVTKQSAMAYTEMTKEEISKVNTGQDIPMVLNQAPSVVVNSDAGNGIGYTGLRIRGTDGTRINVTINGIPVNDAESQGTFFVDMPDLLSSVNSIQIQRGVGASSNGAGAFGASINMQTNTLNEKAYAEVINSAGSFNSIRNTLNVGSGLIGGHWSFDARLSNISSNGYIDRSFSKLNSYYLSGGFYSNKTVVKALMFSGNEKTYQAWYYVPEDSIKKGNNTYNPAGEYFDSNGKVKYYDNETDNYRQDNYQLHLIQTITNKLRFSVAGHYTMGKGYYEQYRANDALANYGLNDVIIGNDTITTSDIIRRRWLDNDFAGIVYSLNYEPTTKLKFVLGGGNNNYYGRHNGEVIWAKYASNGDIRQRYYNNYAFKNDNNIYLKSTVTIAPGISVFLDVQYRNVYYSFLGYDTNLVSAQQHIMYDFFNPKIGLNYNINDKMRAYVSYAMTNKEPNRDDFIQSSGKSRPKYESLNDLEAGMNYSAKNIFTEINFYNMDYTNQLVLNGQVNDVGAYNRVNVAKSYRRGVEIQVGTNITKYISINGNLTLSKNKIKNYTEYVDSASADWSVYKQYKINYKETDISFSPNIIAGGTIVFKPIKNLEVNFINKYVGMQYLDNTSNSKRAINPYYVADARINYSIKTKWHTIIGVNLSAYNLFSTKYQTNGYTFSYYTDTTLNTFNYLAPAAPLHFMAGLSLKFE